MKAILVRIGIDHSYGHWNAPVDPESCEFVYVPIPDGKKKRYNPGHRRTYREIVPALEKFSIKFGIKDMGFPRELRETATHLDPDFNKLTYGDNGKRRGSGIRKLSRGDLLVFYAGLKPITKQRKLVYALVGVYVVASIVRAVDVPPGRWDENAHTRWTQISRDDIVVRASHVGSGRLEVCIPIGEWRNNSYRVRNDVLREWGGLSVKDGFIQRSARPPEFLRPVSFLRWFRHQESTLLERNN